MTAVIAIATMASAINTSIKVKPADEFFTGLLFAKESFFSFLSLLQHTFPFRVLLKRASCPFPCAKKEKKLSLAKRRPRYFNRLRERFIFNTPIHLSPHYIARFFI